MLGHYTVATLLQAHPPGWAFECLGPNVQLELEPTRGGLIIQSERYRLMLFVKMLSLNANTDSLKKIFVNKSSLPLHADKTHMLNYVITDDDGITKVLGTQEHPQYIPLDILSEIITILDTLFIRLHLYDNEDLIEPIPVQ